MAVCGRLLLVAVLVLTGSAESGSSNRQRRYLHFPYGATLKVSASTKWSTLFDWSQKPALWTQGFNWGIIYDLPNGTQLNGPAGLGALASRRSRRDLYRQLEVAIDSTGVQGRPCLLRAICEAPQALPRGANFVAEILRLVLSSPTAKGGSQTQYDRAQASGYSGRSCASIYRDCPFSLLGFVLSLRGAS